MILPTSANDARSLATKILIKAYREIQIDGREINNQTDEGEEDGSGHRSIVSY